MKPLRTRLEEARKRLGIPWGIIEPDYLLSWILAGGNLKAFTRMDGAWLRSIDISIRKARTARFFDMDTGELGKLSQPGGSLYQIEHSNGGLITFPGGVPVKDAAGEVIGAVGVSGSTVENDHAVAKAGRSAIAGK
ncbi:MAG: heme-binding protein [Acidobacteria bacterium]|nr:heme-binding protein [Acidobacteriota bacterium]